jgi:hypothetical protein
MNYIPISGHHLFSYSLSLNLLAITMPSVQNQALPSFNLILRPTDPVLPNLSFPSRSYAISVLCTYSLVWVSSACPILGQSDFFFSLRVFATEPYFFCRKTRGQKRHPLLVPMFKSVILSFFSILIPTLTVNPFIDFRHCLARLELWT